jgi:hypothetical protein
MLGCGASLGLVFLLRFLEAVFSCVMQTTQGQVGGVYVHSCQGVQEGGGGGGTAPALLHRRQATQRSAWQRNACTPRQACAWLSLYSQKKSRVQGGGCTSQ